MEDDLILDAPDAPTNILQPSADVDTEMHIDEEGRPRFAPAKANVRTFSVVKMFLY